MLSTVAELAFLALIVAGTSLLWGSGPALIVAGVLGIVWLATEVKK